MRARFYHRTGAVVVAIVLAAQTLSAGPPSEARAALDRALRGLKDPRRQVRRETLRVLAEGRVVPPDSDRYRQRLRQALAPFLRPKRPSEIRLLAVRALAQLPRQTSGPTLLDLVARERDDRIARRVAAYFRGAAEPWAVELQRRFHEAKDPLHRALLLRVLGGIPSGVTRKLLDAKALSSAHPVERAAALHAIGAGRRRSAAVSLFIEALRAEDPGVRVAGLESLERWTGLGFGRDLDAWRKWAASRKPDDALPLPKEEPKDPNKRYASRDAKDPLTPYWFDIPVKGRKVVFCFDVSQSMRYKLAASERELMQAVKGLPSSRAFEIIFFNEQVWEWRGRMSSADPVTKELLARYIPTIEIKSYTNLFGALERALKLEPDEIFLISDGLPNRGRRKHPTKILSELRRINKRRVSIHTVSVVRTVDGDPHVALLKDIAAQTGGKHVARTLK